MYAPPRSTVLSPAMSSLTRCVTVKECGCVCLRARDRWMPRGGGLDLLIKAKHLLSPPHLQCHKLPTQAAKPCLLSADTVPLLFQCIKHQSRKCYFSYKAKPSQVAASQGSSRSATAFLCQMWLRKLSENSKPLSLFTVFTSLHFSSFNCSCSPNRRGTPRQWQLTGAPSVFPRRWEVSLSPEGLQISPYSHSSQMFHFRHFICVNQTDNKESKDLWNIYE